MHSKTVQIESLEGMTDFAQEFALQLKPGMQIGLVGELGAGKTTLVRELMLALGSPDAVSSPSYVLCNHYRLPEKLEVEHWDLYRISSAPEEFFEPKQDSVIRIVEWPNRFEELMQVLDLSIEIVIPLNGDSKVISEKRTILLS